MSVTSRVLALAASAVLLLTTCTDDDADTGSGTTEASTASRPSTSEATTTRPPRPTAAPPTTQPEPTPSPPAVVVPAWFNDPPAGIIRNDELCPEPEGAPVHYRDRTLLLLEQQVGDATIVSQVLEAVGVQVEAPVDPLEPNDGVVRLDLEQPVDQLTFDAIQALQNVGVAIDVEHLVPLLPNYQPKPDDVPTDANPVQGTKASNDFRVAVLDVGVEPLPSSYTLEAAGYDRQRNEAQYVTAFAAPEFHNHGPFVADLVHRNAVGTVVSLWALPAPLLDAKPTPQDLDDVEAADVIDGAIDEYSLLTILARATGRVADTNGKYGVGAVPDLLNLSLGGSGCAATPHAPLGAALAESASRTLIVAAAGNDGATHYHFPAAYTRRTTPGGAPVGELAAEVAARPASRVQRKVENALGGRLGGPPIADVLATLAPAVVSVGSATPTVPAGAVNPGRASADGDCFSNRGPWVTAWAPGAFQISQYPPAEWKMWSGTSFATPRSAAAIAGTTPAGATPLDFWQTPRSRDPGSYLAAGHDEIQFGLVPTLQYDSPGCYPPP